MATIDSTGTALVPNITASSYKAPDTISSGVITSGAATKDLTKIKADAVDTNNSIQTQAQKIAADKATADATTAAKAQSDAAAKAASDKAATDAAAVAAKNAALGGGTGATPAPIPTDSTFTNAINRGTDQVKSVSNNLDGTRTVLYNDGTSQSIAGDPNDPTQALNKVNNDIKVQGDAVSNQILGIQNGTIPLSPADNAQIAGLKQQFDQLIAQQVLTNTGASGTANIRGYQTGAAEYDPTFAVKTIGSIVTAGANKITDLQVKEASAVADLTQALKDNNIKGIKDAYDIANTARTNTQSALKDTVAKVQKAIDDAKTAKVAADKVQYEQVTKPIQDIATEAAKNGADPATISKINSATDVQSAIIAAGSSLQTGSGQLGDYLQYKKDTSAMGLTPQDFTTWKKADDKRIAKQKGEEAYSAGYNSEAGKAAADSATGGYNGTSQKQQQALEKTFISTLRTENSSRGGAYGINNNKVSQANKLAALFNQSYDPKTGSYNLASSQYGELAIGLASLISGTSSPSDSSIADLKTATAKGDWNKVYSYVTGAPANGSTQDIIKLLASSVQREAQQAASDRDAARAQIESQAPTDLDPTRIKQLTSADGIQYTGINGIAKSEVNDYIKSNPDKAESVAKLYEVPGATDQDVLDYINLQKK